MNQVYKYQCCQSLEYTTTPKNRKCKGCKNKIEPVILKYDNVINIPKFVKQEYPEFNLSPTAIALFFEMIQTVILSQADRCVKKAIEQNEKTIMARSFDWIVMDEFKNWLEYKRNQYDTKLNPTE